MTGAGGLVSLGIVVAGFLDWVVFRKSLWGGLLVDAGAGVEREQGELFRQIYRIATDLVHAGHVSEWDFKSYVLGTMFYRYISENFANYVNAGEHDAGDLDFDYSTLADDEAEPAREGLIEEKGFFILPSELFCNVRARAATDENLNETLERVFKNIESSAASGEAENDFVGLFDDFDVNSKSIGETVAKRNQVLTELLDGVAKMPLYGSGGSHDLFGDVYEYLMGMYAANAGKKGGQYFTPADVSELLARLGTIGKTRVNKVYDPACGSGSLLLKVEKVLGKENITQGFFGQEIDLTTYNLCRINMFLHNVSFDKFDIVREDTLVAPQHEDDGPFDLIVSNPPFSVPWAGNKDPLLIDDPHLVLLACWLQPLRGIWRLSCIHCPGWRIMGWRQLFVFRVSCIGVERKRRSVNIWWIITILMRLFSCRLTCF